MNKKETFKYMGVVIMPYLNNHFHIYDHQSEVSFQIIGKSNFMRWLNDHANNDRYSFFSTYTKLNNYLKEKGKEST
jgi:hypothetical protein